VVPIEKPFQAELSEKTWYAGKMRLVQEAMVWIDPALALGQATRSERIAPDPAALLRLSGI
jgi:hypothetical protein